MKNILDMSTPSLLKKMRAWGEPDYRARQIWSAIYQQQVVSLQQATSLPSSLRQRLASEFILGNLTTITKQHL